jgi:hypothetical protein
MNQRNEIDILPRRMDGVGKSKTSHPPPNALTSSTLAGFAFLRKRSGRRCSGTQMTVNRVKEVQAGGRGMARDASGEERPAGTGFAHEMRDETPVRWRGGQSGSHRLAGRGGPSLAGKTRTYHGTVLVDWEWRIARPGASVPRHRARVQTSEEIA